MLITTDPKIIALQFNDCINNRDLPHLVDLMTDDHTFIDSANQHFSGKTTCKNAWAGFFDAFPDYRNIFEKIAAKADGAIIQGYSVCSDKRLEGPAIWAARMENGKVKEWRVYQDTRENRKALGIDQKN